MLLINIILLILFFIILLWKSKVVEGQSDVPVFNILPGFLKDELILYEKEKKDDRPKETILDTLDEKGIYNEPDQNVNKSTLNTCVDSNDKIFYKNLGINSSPSQSTDTLQVENKNKDIFDFNLLGINFVGDLSDTDSSNNQSLINELSPTTPKDLCGLVDILYDKNTSMNVREKISSEYGDCFYKKKVSADGDGSIFNTGQLGNKCPKSCYKYTGILPVCNKYILNASTCPDLNASSAKTYGDDLFNMAIKPPNGNVFYNCVSPDEQTIQSKLNKASPSGKTTLSLPMNPQLCRFNNVCNPNPSVKNGKNFSCNTHSEEYCEDMYEIDKSPSGYKTTNCMLRPGSTTGKESHVGACFRDLTPGGLTELCETSDVRNDYKGCRIASVPGIFLDPKKVEYAVTIF